jgi:hypothetical protein
MTTILNRPDIKLAVEDLNTLLTGLERNIDGISLFGSTVTIPVEQARDIDFFIAYKNADFVEMRKQILSRPIGRRVVVENLEAQYTNHPEWPKENPVRIHIILYRKGVSKFSEKLDRTRASSLEITSAIP